MVAQTQQKSDWTLKKLLSWTTDYFAKTHLDQPRLTAEILLAHVLDCQRIDLYVRFDKRPNREQLGQYHDLVRRCARQEPAAYLTGKAHFYSLELQVSPAVLIPRPQTELLAAQAIDFLRYQEPRPTCQVLDLCTGSGCVAAAVAANVIEAEVIAADRSRPALQVAQKNIEKYDLQGRVRLVQSDLFDHIDQAKTGVFDLIVANPPYVSAAEYEKLEARIRHYEPKEALLGGEDGLDVFRRIVADAEPYLADAAALMVEVAYNQAEQVIALFQQSGYLTDVSTVKDNLGYQRVVKARKA